MTLSMASESKEIISSAVRNGENLDRIDYESLSSLLNSRIPDAAFLIGATALSH